ncbi:MAG TPA: PEP/pyruvate-binding domain-containing protein, partial [Polyangia bacterium]
MGRSDVGGKAETLARMRAAGLPVADGVVVPADERVDAADLHAALTRLGGDGEGGARFAVRSSSTVEDAAGGSAAGVFESIVDVAAADVGAAIATVRASADAPAVAAYLAARGIARAGVRVAVLIQPLVAAAAYGVAHSAGEAFVVEERAPGVPEWGDVRARRVARGDGGALATGMRALEAIVGGPVDAELASTGDAITWLQARPLVAAAAASSAVTLAEPGRWRLDGEHNPDPLSTAQASLVAFADGLGVGARLRVVDRYLYVEEDGAARAQTRIALGELRRRFDEEIASDCARVLDAAAAAPQDRALDVALAAYAHVYRRYYGEVSPSVGVARKALAKWANDANAGDVGDALLAGAGGATLARDQALWELGRGELTLEEYQARYGDHAPSWDVATPTDRESPARVRALAAELAAQPTSPNARHEAALARAQAALAAIDPTARAEVEIARA